MTIILDIYTDVYDHPVARWPCSGMLAGEPDPPVMCYSEITPTRRPVMVEPSFSGWLEIVVTMAADPS